VADADRHLSARIALEDMREAISHLIGNLFDIDSRLSGSSGLFGRKTGCGALFFSRIHVEIEVIITGARNVNNYIHAWFAA
jgi:hypothetical protein